jgi:superfamily II helicase
MNDLKCNPYQQLFKVFEKSYLSIFDESKEILEELPPNTKDDLLSLENDFLFLMYICEKLSKIIYKQ